MNSRSKILIIAGAAILGAIALFTVLRNTVHIYGDEYEITSTCSAGGGVYKKCSICGIEVCVSETEPTGHNSAWITLKEPTAATSGERELRCLVCRQQLDLIKIPPKESPIPSMRLVGSGVGMTASNSISASFTYADGVEASGAEASEAGGSVNVRLMNAGEPSASKHSYVLNNFKLTDGDTLLFGAFGDSSEIHLYANNDDPTCARRIVTYKQWKDLVEENYPTYSKFISISDDTEYAGYNMLLYIKSTKPDYSFAGIYTLSVPYSTVAEKNTEAGIKFVFRQRITDSGELSLNRVFGNEYESEAAANVLSGLLDGGDDINSYTDIKVLVDYYTFAILTNNSDAFSDIYWVTSDGQIWYPVPANTEHSYGSMKGTTELVGYDAQAENIGVLWTSVAEIYAEDVSKRMEALSSGRLSVENISREFENAISKLDEDVYKEDYNTYRQSAKNAYKSPSDEVEKLSEWYRKRIAFLAAEE